MFAGIDLTASERKPSACAALGDDGRVVEIRLLREDTAIVEWAAHLKASVIGIDAPLSLPRGLCCLEASCDCAPDATDRLKAAERELLRHGIGLYVTTKRSIIKAMVYRGIRLREGLRSGHTEVLEVYPFGAKVALFGRPIPKKSSAAGRVWLQENLRALIPGLDGMPRMFSHDELDALLAAYTAYLYGKERTEAFGDADEGMIYLPLTISAQFPPNPQGGSRFPSGYFED